MPYKDPEAKQAHGKRYYEENRQEILAQRREYSSKKSEEERDTYLQYTRTYVRELAAQRKNEGLCVHCGKPARTSTTQCQECFDYRRQHTKEKRRQLKRKAVEYLGGRCADCGLQTDFISVYEFHHTDVSNKQKEIARLIQTVRTWEPIRAEIDKCTLLCANCHRIRHEIEDRNP